MTTMTTTTTTQPPPYLSPAQVGRLYSRDGKPLHPTTVARWILRGAATRAGKRIRLAALRRPGGWLILQADVEAFLAELGASGGGADDKPTEVASKVDERAVDAAMAALARRGY